MQRASAQSQVAFHPRLGPAAGHSTQPTSRPTVSLKVPGPAFVVDLFQPEDQPVVAGTIDGQQLGQADSLRHVALEATSVHAWLVQPVELFEHDGVVLGRYALNYSGDAEASLTILVNLFDQVTLPDHVFSRLDGLNRRAGHDIRPHLDLTIEGMRGTFGALLGILPTDGARPSELAEAMRISKQAVGQRLVEMEARGWITISPDPIDKRARIVTRTPAGDEIKAMSEQAIAAMERNWADQVGADRYRVFKEVLNELALG